ncbi:hypothetical protein [Actinoplanes sp. NPDC049265]|uniref:hypothetical protein n=1 Tax=Actinoplanes sp. NPDC049265 TaxID=3363902 RepID=UPI00372121F6
MKIISVRDPAGIWRKRVNPALDDFEERSTLILTEEHENVLRQAQGRRLLSSTVNAYVHARERIVGFGQGGSESMTIFIRKDGHDAITVRKILSEALTTARWDPAGTGVMLPPFAKARKQAEFLQGLPEPVRHNFPLVYDVEERRIPSTDGTHREVIYEMSYVDGEEVSRFIERNSPPAAVTARLYEVIIRTLHENIHTVHRLPAPGDTLETSYFAKIEERLNLCRRTAPATFNGDLLDTEEIVIDGRPYRNAGPLLRAFRARADYRRILEPRYHSLVMGDTNTENIKVADTGPLLRAQRLIEAGAPADEVTQALEAITAHSVGIKFLDPRAIGYQGEGKQTRDDPMYDNKPWHNSIGHYDEIHYEQFDLRVRTGGGRTPDVSIIFRDGNPYQRAYRIRDVTEADEPVDQARPDGMEDHFAGVMTRAYGLDRPHPPFLDQDPYWLIRFVFMMGTHFTAMPPFHFQAELDGTLIDTFQTQRRPVAIYCMGIKWLNWALQMLEGTRTTFLGLPVPPLPWHNDGRTSR